MSKNNYKELPYNKKLAPLAKKLRKAGILSEVLLWNEIKGRKINNLNFDRQKVIGNYIVDFYCPEIKLVIEIDGSTHDFKVEKDKKRDDFLAEFGIKVIRVLDCDVKKNLIGVVELLKKEATPRAFQAHPSQEGN